MESHQRDHENFLVVSRNRRRRAKALLDFERHDDDELGFRKNDIITVSHNLQKCWQKRSTALTPSGLCVSSCCILLSLRLFRKRTNIAGLVNSTALEVCGILKKKKEKKNRKKNNNFFFSFLFFFLFF